MSKATITAFIHREAVGIAPYAAGFGVASLTYLDSVLTSAHPSGQLAVALVMLGTLATKGAIVWLRKQHPITP